MKSGVRLMDRSGVYGHKEKCMSADPLSLNAAVPRGIDVYVSL